MFYVGMDWLIGFRVSAGYVQESSFDIDNPKNTDLLASSCNVFLNRIIQFDEILQSDWLLIVF